MICNMQLENKFKTLSAQLLNTMKFFIVAAFWVCLAQRIDWTAEKKCHRQKWALKQWTMKQLRKHLPAEVLFIKYWKQKEQKNIKTIVKRNTEPESSWFFPFVIRIKLRQKSALLTKKMFFFPLPFLCGYFAVFPLLIFILNTYQIKFGSNLKFDFQKYYEMWCQTPDKILCHSKSNTQRTESKHHNEIRYIREFNTKWKFKQHFDSQLLASFDVGWSSISCASSHSQLMTLWFNDIILNNFAFEWNKNRMNFLLVIFFRCLLLIARQ